MAVKAITKEGRESLKILTAELKKSLPALEAELMARFDKKMEEAGESFSQVLEEEKETIKNLAPPTAKQVAALKGENTKLRKQLGELEARVDGMAATLAAGNVGEDAPLSVASVNERVTRLRDVIAPWMANQEALVNAHEALIQKLKPKFKRYLA